jgi:hypothetical protein
MFRTVLRYPESSRGVVPTPRTIIAVENANVVDVSSNMLSKFGELAVVIKVGELGISAPLGAREELLPHEVDWRREKPSVDSPLVTDTLRLGNPTPRRSSSTARLIVLADSYDAAVSAASSSSSPLPTPSSV